MIPPWDDLDVGIRDTVRALWAAGFQPTDSGDGSKFYDIDGAIVWHHVFMRCAPERLIIEANRLALLVANWPAAGTYEGNRVEANYSPTDGVGVLMLFGCVAPASANFERHCTSASCGCGKRMRLLPQRYPTRT
jgi:hypothetical protein